MLCSFEHPGRVGQHNQAGRNLSRQVKEISSMVSHGQKRQMDHRHTRSLKLPNVKASSRKILSAQIMYVILSVEADMLNKSPSRSCRGDRNTIIIRALGLPIQNCRQAVIHGYSGEYQIS